MTQFAQGFGFDLSNALTGHIKLFAHFFQSVVGIHVYAKTHAQDFGFAWVKLSKTSLVTSRKPEYMAASDGATLFASSMKSPKCESSSSPIGVSMEIAFLAIFMILRHLQKIAVLGPDHGEQLSLKS